MFGAGWKVKLKYYCTCCYLAFFLGEFSQRWLLLHI